MPPTTRGTKTAKSMKENKVAVDKTRTKPIGKIVKPARKALADKTNSASDDNTSLETKRKSNKGKHEVIAELEKMPRSRRERRIPKRYVGNNMLNNLSNSKIQSDSGNVVSKSTKHHNPPKAINPVKISSNFESPFKTPQKSLENSLLADRPKRICRLPSKFDDHFISPSKYIPVKPCHASTPILENKSFKNTEVTKSKEKKVQLTLSKIIPEKQITKKRHFHNSPEVSSDSNNNAKRRLVRQKITEQDPKDKVETTTKLPKKVTNKSFSLRILDTKKNSQNEHNNLDVYEFTYDPNEEPPPAKKKRKKTVKNKPSKPKTYFVSKNNYNLNLSKALEALKKAVAKNPDGPKSADVEHANAFETQAENRVERQNDEQMLQQNSIQVATKETSQSVKTMPTNPIPSNPTNQIEGKNYNSVRVEDIAADFEMRVEDNNSINYSPVNSPQHPQAPVGDHHETFEKSVHNDDPLNLREDLSFFDDNPVASSSMNMSTRHPNASPWRVEFSNLPIKWHVNTYVKPNMTPAVESSFIDFEGSKKKHVYTNMIGHDDSAPEVVQNQSNLKQTSIISFIREVVQKSAQKKKRERSVTPKKQNNIFDDLSTEKNANEKTPKKSEKVDRNKSDENVSNSDSKHDKEKSNEITENIRKQSKQAETDKDGTFFGFDECEDQENVSPVKVNPKVRALRPRSRAVLQEINAMSGPMRALPLAAKTKIAASSDAVNKVYEEMKSAADAPVFPEKRAIRKSKETTTVDEDINDMDEDSQSVHLFEDIELVHHLKPTRKSYGKAKKVTIREHSTSSETPEEDREKDNVSSGEEDDLADLTFTMPTFEPQKKAKKRKAKKQTMSKKEKQALEEWAAGFNSMCEDIEDVPLVVE